MKAYCDHADGNVSPRSFMGRLAGPLGRRVGWGLVDQALSSVTNFALAILVARSVSAREFGAFTLVLAAYAIMLGSSRALTTEAFVVRFSAVDEATHRQATKTVTGAVLLVGILFAVLTALAASLLSGTLRAAFVPLAVTVPLLLLQDSWRQVFFAAGKPAQAAANDLVWATAQAVFYVALFMVTEPQAPGLLYAWGAAAGVAAAFGLWQSRSVPDPSRARDWWRAHRDLSGRFAIEHATISSAMHATFYGISAIAGLTAAGVIRGAQVILGPITLLIQAVTFIAVPEGVRAKEQSLARLKKGCMAISAVATTAALAWGAVALMLPERVGEALLGESWPGARAVLPALSVAWAGMCAAAGPLTGIRAMGAARVSLRVMAVSSPVTLLATLFGAFVAGASGAAAGFAFGGVVQATLAWLAFGRVLRGGARRFLRSSGGVTGLTGVPE